MEQQKRNWLIAAIVIAIVILILLLLNWSSENRRDAAGSNMETSSVSGSEAGSMESGTADQSTMDHSNMDQGNGGSGSQTDLQNYRKDQDAIMSRMMKEMNAVPQSGNASVDFLKGMIPHHQSAIEMAESYLEYGGQNSELKQLADDIIKAQTTEIEEMNKMISRISDSGRTDDEKAAAYLKEYDRMMKSHEHAGHSTAADVDQAFAEGMIMHHQMAVDMAKAILTSTDEEDVKTLAQTIIDTQEKEIKQMQDVIGQNMP